MSQSNPTKTSETHSRGEDVDPEECARCGTQLASGDGVECETCGELFCRTHQHPANHECETASYCYGCGEGAEYLCKKCSWPFCDEHIGLNTHECHARDTPEHATRLDAASIEPGDESAMPFL